MDRSEVGLSWLLLLKGEEVSPINETEEQRRDEAAVIAALEWYFSVPLVIQPKLPPLDALSEYGHAFETKGRRDHPEKIDGWGGVFVEGTKLLALEEHPMGFFVPYFYDPYVAFLIHHSRIRKGKRAKMNRTRKPRGQDDRDEGWNVLLKRHLTIRWRDHG